MNRREMFKGLAAALAAASIPIPIPLEEYGTLPALNVTDMVKYLNWVKHDLITKIANPPTMLEGHRITRLPTTAQEEALRYVETVLKELE